VTPTSALAGLGRRLAEFDAHLGFGVGSPEVDGWFGFDELVRSGLVDRLAAQLVAREGRRDVAGSYLGSHLASPVVRTTVASILLERRCPDPSPANVVVHLDEDGCFDRVSFRRPTMVVLAGDVASADPSAVVVSDPAALVTWWAGRVVATLGPLFDGVRRRLPYGRRGLWGAVADRVAAVAMAVSRSTAMSGQAAWDDASDLLDALGRRVPVGITRPQPLPVLHPGGGEGWFVVRGTCCLYYRTVADPDPCGDGYCTTCPFTDPDHRRRKLAGVLAESDRPTTGPRLQPATAASPPVSAAKGCVSATPCSSGATG
jgi:hypothetical protein